MKSLTVQIVGKRFGDLVVLTESKVVNQRRWYLCQCDCGNQKFIRGDQLKGGQSKSCCKRWTNGIKHGMRETRFYNIWSVMLSRTKNKSNPYYGGRGIKVCKVWTNFGGFKDDMLALYLKHVEDYGVKNTQIDRINNDKGYEKSNCRWVTIKEQSQNRRPR